MSKSPYKCYMGINPLEGSLNMIVPNKFIATADCNYKRTLEVNVSVDEEDVGDATARFIQNGLFVRRAVESGIIAEWDTPKRLIRNFNKYMLEKNRQKAINLAAGYSRGAFMDATIRNNSILRHMGERFIGKREAKEESFLVGYHYSYAGQNMFTIPDNLFAMLDKTGTLRVDIRPDFLKEATERIYSQIENPMITPFPIKQKIIDTLEEACMTGDNVLRDDIIKAIIEDNKYLIQNGN